MVCHQVLLVASNAIESLFLVMREAMEHGVELKRFCTDNGIFKSKAFMEALKDNYQMITKSGVGAHHQNGVAEWLLEQSKPWLEPCSCTCNCICQMSLIQHCGLLPNYAVEKCNNLPTKVKNGLCLNEVFADIILGCGLLKQLQVFGCPYCALDTRIQDGKKIPK